VGAGLALALPFQTSGIATSHSPLTHSHPSPPFFYHAHTPHTHALFPPPALLFRHTSPPPPHTQLYTISPFPFPVSGYTHQLKVLLHPPIFIPPLLVSYPHPRSYHTPTLLAPLVRPWTPTTSPSSPPTSPPPPSTAAAPIFAPWRLGWRECQSSRRRWPSGRCTSHSPRIWSHGAWEMGQGAYTKACEAQTHPPPHQPASLPSSRSSN
jgi:hypothetical protein